MRHLTLSLLCVLMLPACLTQGLQRWAEESYPTSARPIHCGLDADGNTVILVAASDSQQPSFSLVVPSDWRERTQVSIEESGGSFHSPLLLSRSPSPSGAVDSLTPTAEEWFLRHEPGAASVDVLINQDGGQLVVGSAQLQANEHKGRKVVAAVLTPVTFVVDTVVTAAGGLFFLWLQSDIPWPWSDDSDYEDSDSSDGPSSGLIMPAHPPS